MKHILEGIEPATVMQYFEEICSIPHISFHTEKITQYLIEFAQSRELKYCTDDSGNVVIYKNASVGYESHDAVLLQGHIDMVGEKTEDSNHDFLNDPLQLVVDGDFIKTVDTTLGADDGIAVAYMLAILSDDTLKHPPLECAFTVNEEVGLLGAAALDMSLFKAKTMLNLDSEDEGIFTVGCAGGIRLDCKLPMVSNPITEGFSSYMLVVSGLRGGHSGQMIGTGRTSAICVLGRFLDTLADEVYFQIASMKGGNVDNAICVKTEVDIAFAKEDLGVVLQVIQSLQNDLKKEYDGIEDDISISIVPAQNALTEVLSDTAKEKCIFFMRNMPYGVQARNAYDINLVETSLNPGVLRCDLKEFSVGFSIRSSVETAKHDLESKLIYLTEFLGGETESSGDYPGWSYNADSKLRPMIDSLYQEMFEKKPIFITIHAGLECGLFCEGVPNLDIISYGPDIHDIHTFDERLSISSAKRMYDLTIRLLEQL